ncbi:hypothetical protein [Microbacterium halotolerans]|uniref:hypothetical protein n=1 Tax=Microbacterium halotolerans TaxID=246613 RepID=UPI000E6AB5B0|nr:hypothetical protein [Microbacterium halotolerans]
MSTAPEAERILDRIEQGEYADQAHEQVAQAVRLADEAGADDTCYRARMLQTDIAHWLNDADTMLSSFAWCVAKHDSDPARFPIARTDDGPDLLFQHKWIAGLLAGNSRFPIARIEQVLSDMERRFREAGLSQNGVHQARRDVAIALGDFEAAERHMTARELTPRDEYSHCEACQRSTDAGFAALQGDDGQALRLWREIHDQDLSCGEEPEFADAQALLPLLRAGSGDEAMIVHARSYRAARTNPDAISMVRFHLEFCAVTGNVERGLELLQRHLSGFTVDAFSDQHHMGVLRSIAVLLDAAVEAGAGERELVGSDGENIARLFGERKRQHTVSEFRDRAWSIAERIGAAFDGRNGNDRCARDLAAARALRTERYDLPFSDAETYAPLASAHPEPSDARGWLIEARRLVAGGHLARADEAAARGVQTATPGAAPPLHTVRVWAALGDDDEASAMAHHRARVAAMREAGWHDYADAEERLGLKMLGNASRDDVDEIAAEIERARSQGGDPSLLVDLLITLAATQFDAPETPTGGVDAALAAVREAALTLPDDDENMLWPGLVDAHLEALTRAELFEEAGEVAALALEDPRAADTVMLTARRVVTISMASKARFDEAATASERLIADAARAEDPIAVGNSAMLAAQIYADLGRPREASARAAYAIRSFEQVGQALPGQRHTLASLQLDAGQAQAALENFQLAFDAMHESGEEDPVVLSRVASGLGRAAAECGELAVAYRVWTWAARVAADAEIWDRAAAVTLDVASLLHDVDDEDAVDTAAEGVELARRSGVPALLARAQQLHGWFSAGAGNDAGVAVLDEAIGAAEAAELWDRALDARISRGRALLALGRRDEAIGALRETAEAADSRGMPQFARLSDIHRATALTAAGRTDEAAVVYRELIDRLDPADDSGILEAAHSGLAELGD